MGEKIQRARKQRGWSQWDLASQAKVPQATLSRLENGTLANPTVDTLRKLSLTLGISMDYLAGVLEAIEEANAS
jgi:transcriptional regulator with XRE-family HTH domain